MKISTRKIFEKFKLNENNKLIKYRIKSSFEKSTSHGIPKIIENNNIVLKLLWIMFTIISTSLCALLVTKNILNYYKYDVTTKIRVVNEYNPLFPSVTICNSAHFTTEYAAEFIKNITLSKNNESVKGPTQYLYQKLYQISNKTDELKKIGDSFEKLIRKYSYNILNNNQSENFEFILHPLFGNCYTFNSTKFIKNLNTNTDKKMKDGFYSSLKVDLNVSISQKISYITGRSAIIFIHEHGTSPLTVNPIAIPPKYDFQIVLRKIKSSKLPKPFSDCSENIEDENKYNSKYYKSVYSSFKYSQKLCLDFCFHTLMLKKCSCYVRKLSLSDGGEPCLTEEKYQCALEYYKKFFKSDTLNQICLPNCPLECDSVVFTTTTSMLSNRFDQNESDICSVSIKYEDFSFIQIDESPILDATSLLSNIGGIAGLFLGLSVLSFVEIFALFTEIFQIMFKKEIKSYHLTTSKLNKREIVTKHI